MTHQNDTPLHCGYRLPAEWEPHAATWLAWPHNRETWPGKFDQALQQFERFARTIAELEPLHVLAGSDAVMRSAESWLGRLNHVTLHDIPTDDAWIRDFGPIFVTSPTEPLAVVDWQYNAWGNKYPPFDKDNAATGQIASRCELGRFEPGMVLEGGSADGNGQGIVMTTKSCLLNPNRNPHLRQADIEKHLRQYLCASQVIWLEGHIAGDDTDGHIDQLARFVGENTVVVAHEDDEHDENFGPLQSMLCQLQRTCLPDDLPLTIVQLPMPAPVRFNQTRLPASYANFYIANSAVIVPQFDDPADDRACDILQELFPNRDVIALPCVDLLWGLGAFHCLSQQQPAS